MLLSLLGVAASAALINSAAKRHQQKANPNLDRAKFDAQNAEYGIATSSLGFTEQKIMDIAARCGIRPNKNGVLPPNGWKLCMKYVSKYINHPDDLINFERDWLQTVERQMARRSTQLINESEDNYEHLCKNWYGGYPGKKPEKDLINYTHKSILEVKHWHGLPREEHVKRIYDIYTNTILCECCCKPPILRPNPRIKDSHVETWVFGCLPHQKPNTRLTRNAHKCVYEDCCEHLGYDPAL